MGSQDAEHGDARLSLYLLDTPVLISHLRGDEATTSLLLDLLADRHSQLEREYGPEFLSGARRRMWEAELRLPLALLSDFDRRGMIAGETATSGPEPQEPKAITSGV